MQSNFEEVFGQLGQAFLSGMAGTNHDSTNQGASQNLSDLQQTVGQLGQAFVSGMASTNGHTSGQQQNPTDFTQAIGQLAQAFSVDMENASSQPDLAQVFESIAQVIGQAVEHDFENLDQENGTHPTSTNAWSALPKVNVTAYDLEQTQNSNCTVCIEHFKLAEEAMRLPCGHLFHECCVKPWLQKHCQCPVCRYELPTDNTFYEHARQARMSQRKLRMRLRDLSIKSVNELRCLAQHLGVNLNGCLEKTEVVDRIVTSGCIELAPDNEGASCAELEKSHEAPRNPTSSCVELMPDNEDMACFELEKSHEVPLQMSREKLQAMSVRELKSEMKRVGVDPKGCLEKHDMIEKLLNPSECSYQV